jgi:ABC-type phosphate/phosphonate transport system substrate-binding protein
VFKKSVWAFILLIQVASPLNAQLKTDPILLGIFPYVSTGRLITHHSKLRSHLNRQLNKKVSLVTAKNIDTYFENIKSYQYDLILTPPHLAYYAQNKLAYEPLVMTSHQIRGVFLVAIDSPYLSLSDIENATLSMVSAKALLHQIAWRQLEQNGLVDGETVNVESVKTHSNAIYNLLMQDSQVALTGIRMWQNLPPGKKQKLRQIAVTESTAGFVVLAKPGLNPIFVDELRQYFLSFNLAMEEQPYIFEGFEAFDQNAVNLMQVHSFVFE